jgi:hypothetical protein
VFGVRAEYVGTPATPEVIDPTRERERRRRKLDDCVERKREKK